MNETLKVLETRRSCRNFDREKMVPEEDIQAIVKAGTYGQRVWEDKARLLLR